VFFKTAQSLPHSAGVARVAGVDPLILTAVSLGAVFMGAMTYIGNGPNFMVRAIAEESGVKMPSFFGYVAYSCLILLPILALVVWRFLMQSPIIESQRLQASNGISYILHQLRLDAFAFICIFVGCAVNRRSRKADRDTSRRRARILSF